MASIFPVLTLNSFLFADIKVGDVYTFERFIDAELVNSFARVSGDYNPLHMDEAYGAHTQIGGRVAHGMLLASFFSALAGMLCPGLRCLYLSQDIRFKKPVFLNTSVMVRGIVTGKSEATSIIMLKTVIMDKDGIIAVEGEANLQVRDE